MVSVQRLSFKNVKKGSFRKKVKENLNFIIRETKLRSFKRFQNFLKNKACNKPQNMECDQN